MVILKSILFLIPLVIFFLVIATGLFIRSIVKKPAQKKVDDSMVKCAACETYTHQSLIIKKFGNSYCSDKCSNT